MEEVRLERLGRSSRITLSRPEARNALTRGVVKAIGEAFVAAAADEGSRVVVLRGAGGHFCAGADLKRTFAEDPNLLDNLEGYLDDYHALVRAIVRCPKPTVAVIEGAAVGFGADMALACDLRIASTTAYIQEKFVKIGLMPDGGGTFWLPRLIGTARAMKAMLLADKLEADALDALGLLVSVHAPEALDAAAEALVADLEGGPPLAYASIKSAAYASLGDLEGALAREREGQLRLLRSSDAMEGIAAWAQKRPPEFSGT
jgi:2-(1,2-epoxy-1,2-dihydrophenyl)acetyl-CoA isomerase